MKIDQRFTCEVERQAYQNNPQKRMSQYFFKNWSHYLQIFNFHKSNVFFIYFCALIFKTYNMKHKILLLSIISLFLLSFSIADFDAKDQSISPKSTNTTTSGVLNVSTLTSNAGGNYAPRNIVAIWIEDSAGVFVKSLLVYAQTYKHFLTHWVSKSSMNTTDAVTGATVNSHATRSCTWNGKNKNGVLVPDGRYRICFELTDKNATGNYTYFEIVKGPAAQTITPANVPSFSNISIIWTPNNPENVIDFQNLIQSTVIPNPNNGQFDLQLTQIPENAQVEFYNSLGQLIQVEPIRDFRQSFQLKTRCGMVYYTIRSNHKILYQGNILVR